jgi:3'(2'), 5'-bisphosphate nucleotidase
MDLTQELETARRIALEAADLVRSFFGRDLTVDRKAGDEPVTEADRAASALIVEALVAAFPTDGILSEELPDDGSRFQRERVWMIDPIDGTREFIQGQPGFAVMIGLCVGGRPALGVVSQPVTHTTWAGAVGHGAWKEGADAARIPLRPSKRDRPSGVRLVASKSHRTAEIDGFRSALGITDELNVGGVGLKVGLVADGSRDLYVYAGSRTKLWDTCAPEAIIAAAGGRLTDTFGSPLVYTQPELKNRAGLLASNGHLHDLAVKTLADLRAQARGKAPP